MSQLNKKRTANNVKSYLSKPANLITILFLVILILTVVIPLFTLLIGSFKVNGNQEAIYIMQEGVEDGSFSPARSLTTPPSSSGPPWPSRL